MSFTENWFMPFFGVGKKVEERGRSEEEIRERFCFLMEIEQPTLW